MVGNNPTDDSEIPKLTRTQYRLQKKHEIAERRALVSAMYKEGKSMRDIAKSLHCDPNTVCEDIHAMLAEWQKTAGINISAHIAIASEKIRRIEEEAWEAYRRSEKPKRSAAAHKNITTVVDDDGTPKRYTNGQVITVENSTSSATEYYPNTGEERFLARAAWCVDAYMKLFGLAGQATKADKEKDANQPQTWVAMIAKEIAEREAKTINVTPKPKQLTP